MENDYAIRQYEEACGLLPEEWAVDDEHSLVDRVADLVRDVQKLEGRRCNMGHHNALPLKFWDCPTCTAELRVGLRAERDVALAKLASAESILAATADRLGVALREVGIFWWDGRGYSESLAVRDGIVALYDKGSEWRQEATKWKDAFECEAAKLKDAEEQADSLADYLNAAEARVRELEEAESMLKIQLGRMTAKASNQTVELRKLHMKRRDIEHKDKALTNAREAIAAAQAEAASWKAKAEAAESSASVAFDCHNRLLSEMDERRRECVDLRAQLQAERERVRRLEEQLEAQQ